MRAARPQDDLLQFVSRRLSGSTGGSPAKIILRYVIRILARFFVLLVVLKRSVHAVLRGRCLSVDAPIQGATPALAILGSLVTPTPKHSLTICRACIIFASIIKTIAIV